MGDRTSINHYTFSVDNPEELSRTKHSRTEESFSDVVSVWLSSIKIIFNRPAQVGKIVTPPLSKLDSITLSDPLTSDLWDTVLPGRRRDANFDISGTGTWLHKAVVSTVLDCQRSYKTRAILTYLTSDSETKS